MCMQGGEVLDMREANSHDMAFAAPIESRQPPQVVSRPWCGRFALPSSEFSAETVGAKSLNTVKLRVRSCPLIPQLLSLIACKG